MDKQETVALLAATLAHAVLDDKVTRFTTRWIASKLKRALEAAESEDGEECLHPECPFGLEKKQKSNG